MYRRLLAYVRAPTVSARGARAGTRAFWKQHRWRLLAWPAGALLVLGLGWLVLLQQLEAKRRQVELKALQDAQTLASG